MCVSEALAQHGGVDLAHAAEVAREVMHAIAHLVEVEAVLVAALGDAAHELAHPHEHEQRLRSRRIVRAVALAALRERPLARKPLRVAPAVVESHDGRRDALLRVPAARTHIRSARRSVGTGHSLPWSTEEKLRWGVGRRLAHPSNVSRRSHLESHRLSAPGASHVSGTGVVVLGCTIRRSMPG